ncbi:uncharacterized protein LOC125944962 [Dermacentor silvarum]|uniref:uncharacterized protein LOC125944962 n=1 Tax=Dermacentor silvarum TaxID=543639 RepID=UPI0021007525|nr:uncharacterized protein LOC125944962 [Dermacentor silvarum]
MCQYSCPTTNPELRDARRSVNLQILPAGQRVDILRNVINELTTPMSPRRCRPSAKDAIARPVNAPSAPDDPCTAAALPPPLAEAAKVGDDVREAAVHVSVAVDSHPRRSNASLPKMQYVHRRRSKASRNQDEDDWNKVTIMETFSPPMSRLDGVKTTLATSAQWSFFPMNVTFETEPESAQERYMQTVVLITMAVTFVLLVVLVTLMVYKRRSEPLGICNTSECIELHEFLSRLLNSSEDICSDFYGRVCNSWLGGGHSSFKDSKAVFVATINERLMLQHNGHGIVPGVNARALEGTHVMQRLYQSCHRYASEKSTAATFTETLESARKDLNWAQIREAHSYRELITLLVRTSLLAGFHTVFALELFDERGKVVVRLSAGRSLLCKLTLFSRRKQLEFILERITEDVNEAQEVAKLDPIVHGQLGCEDAGALEDEPEQLDELLEHMVPDVAATDWVYALNAVLASTRNSVRASDTALSSGVDRVQGAFEVISDHVNVTTAALYLSSHVDAEILFLDLSREHAAADSPTATQFCVSVVRRCLPYAWPLLEARALDLERDPLVLRAMYHKLKEASRRAIVFTWLPEATVATAAKQIDRAALILVADDLHENAGGDVDYAWLASQLEVTDSADFVRLFVRFLMHEHERRLWRPPTRIQLIEMQHEQRSQMTYVAALAAVVVPTVFQSPPMLYSTSVPTYFNYGTVGTLLAASIVEIILPAAVYHPHHSQGGSHRNHDGSSGLWTPAAQRKYNESTRCLWRLYWRLGLQRRQLGGINEQQQRAMFLRTLGLRLAYDSLKTLFREAVAEHVERDGFSDLWPLAEVAFFARSCLLSCDAGHRSNPLSPRANCLIPLHNMPEFRTAFNCSAQPNFVWDNCLL